MAASLIKNLEELEDLDVDIPESLLIAQNKSAAAFDKGMGAGAASIAPKVTLNIGTISGGLKNNMVPSECSFDADIRLPVGCNINKVLQSIKDIIAGYPEASMEQNMLNPPSHCDPDGEMMQILQKKMLKTARLLTSSSSKSRWYGCKIMAI